MIVLKYVKTGEARFISHIDLLRHFTRILRRGGIDVRRSNGFNPHALVFFSPPLALGVQSLAEYVAIDAYEGKDEVFEKYNKATLPTLRAVKAYELKSNPNLQGNVVAADYVYDAEYRDIDISNFVIRYVKNDTCVEENASDRIYAAEDSGGKLLLRLALGNVNLRPDRLLDELNIRLSADLTAADVVKIKQYVKRDGRLLDADEFLSLAERDK